jgi:hypothetical protein
MRQREGRIDVLTMDGLVHPGPKLD